MTVPSSESRFCAACGTRLRGDEPAGWCLKCLLLAGVANDSGTHLHVRCPHCQIAIELVDDPSVREVTCPSCDSKFSLVGEIATTIVAEHGGRIGRFELLERVGTGAFGSVWKARDPELDRCVAVKIPRKEQLSAEEAEQFLREARAAGQLQHPGIVAVHEVGRDGDRIYIVSDFVQGVTLADSMSARRPAVRDAARLCRLVALALQHAHLHGVIHRDLKPSNIILDGSGQPHVMDFGLAKREAAEITMTVEGRILGTPAYMSPEQARGDAHRADARSDVYSLGVILFELLTGEKPFRGTSQMLLHQVLNEDAPSPRTLNGSVSRDLETICLKCLEKEPDGRFPSAHALADELQHFLDGEPIRARPISPLQRGWRWCRRNPAIAGLIAAVAASLVIGLGTTFWQWRIAQYNLDDATEARGIAVQSQQEAQAALRESESRLARVYVERGLQKIDVDPHSGLPWLNRALATEPIDSPTRDMHRLRIGLMLRELPTLVGYWPEAADAAFSDDGSMVAVAVGREARVFRLPQMQPVPAMPHDHSVRSVRFTRQADRLATVSWTEGGPPLCRLWNASTGKPETDSLDLTEREYNLRDLPTIHFTPDGDRFVAVYAGLYNRWHSKMVTRVFDSHTLQQLSKTFAHHSDLDFTAGYHQLSPDATRVLVPRGAQAGHPGIAWVDAKFPEEMHRPQQYNLLTAAQVHPPLEQPLEYYGMPIYSVDGSLIATTDDRSVKLWNADNGTLAKEFLPSSGEKPTGVQFHPDGKSLFIREHRRTSWRDIATGNLKKEWTHEDKFNVDPAGRYLVWRDPNGQDYIAALGPEAPQEWPLPDLYSVTFCPDGSRLLLNPTSHFEAGVFVSPPKRVHRSSDAEPLSPPWRFSRWVTDQPFSRSGRHLLAKDDTGIWLWDLDQRSSLVERFPAGRTLKTLDAATTQDRRKLVVLTEDLAVTCWDTETGQQASPPFQIPRPTSTANEARWLRLTLNAAGTTVAILGEYRAPTPENKQRDVPVLQYWDLQTGRQLFDSMPFQHESRTWIESIRFLRNDKQLVVTQYVFLRERDAQGNIPSDDLTRLHMLDAATGVALRPAQDFKGAFRLLNFTSDYQKCLVYREPDSQIGARNPTSTEPAFAQVFETESWQPVTSRMTPNQGPVWNARLSPDGSRVVMGAAEVWDVATGKRTVQALLPHRSVGEIVFQDDGLAFLAVTDEGSYSWNRTSEIRRFSVTGESLATPMVNSRTGMSHCAIHPRNHVLASAGEGLRIWDARQGTALTGALEIHGNFSDGRVDNHRRTTFFTVSGNRLYIEAGEELLQVPWKELFDTIPADNILAAWAEILSGERIDQAGAVLPMTAGDYQAAWETIQKANTNRHGVP